MDLLSVVINNLATKGGRPVRSRGLLRDKNLALGLVSLYGKRMLFKIFCIFRIQVNKVGYLLVVFFGLVGCQINFDADLYSSDLISLEPILRTEYLSSNEN